MCLGGSELQNSQPEENPKLHILVQCHHLSDTVINNVFESFKSARFLGGGVHGKFPWSVSVEMNSNAKVTTIARLFSPKSDSMGNPHTATTPGGREGDMKADLLFESTPLEK